MADGSVLAAEALGDAVATSAAGRKARRRGWRRFKVDLWATDLNDAEIGILQRTRNEAASDQFTKDMELYGQTVIDGKREALIAYRKELWNEAVDFDRRLVIKLFSETLGWRGTLEMLVGRSIQLSRGSGVPVPAFSINLARHDQLIQLERCARKWPLLPEAYTFFIETKQGPRFYTLRRYMFSFGADYAVLDQQGRRIGHLDHQIVNLGGSWIVKLDPAYANRKLETVLELFCAMLRFNGASRRHIADVSGRIRDGKLTPKLNHREADLYYNPRRRR
ncbi:MAG: hypothetical protein AAGJ29_06925 [Pseudomonadota bacterium]